MRNGRPPSDNPKSNRKSYRLSDDDMRKLRFCVVKTGMTETNIIRNGIEKFYTELLTHTKDKELD